MKNQKSVKLLMESYDPVFSVRIVMASFLGKSQKRTLLACLYSGFIAIISEADEGFIGLISEAGKPRDCFAELRAVKLIELYLEDL